MDEENIFLTKTKATIPNLRTQEVDPSTLIADLETASTCITERTSPITGELEKTLFLALDPEKTSPFTSE